MSGRVQPSKRYGEVEFEPITALSDYGPKDFHVRSVGLRCSGPSLGLIRDHYINYSRRLIYKDDLPKLLSLMRIK